VIFGNAGYQLLRAAAGLVAAGAPGLIFPSLYLLLSWYLIANVDRLAREQSAPPPGAERPAQAAASAPKSAPVPVGLLLFVLGPALGAVLANKAAAADAAGSPHIFWILTDVARTGVLAGLGCMLIGALRNRRSKKQLAGRAA
jgi:hypothetical protein